MWLWVRLYGANELQKGCFEADVLLFGCLWVACGCGCVCMGQMSCKSAHGLTIKQDFVLFSDSPFCVCIGRRKKRHFRDTFLSFAFVLAEACKRH